TVLEDVFVPLYFFHRYQAEAAAKMIGGMEYSYAVKGDEQTIVKPIDPKIEREALQSLLNSISVENLKIPTQILALFPPRAYGYERGRETFGSKNGVAFDALSASSTAAELVLELLFHQERASRIVQQKALFNNQLGLDELIDQIMDATFKRHHLNNYDNEIQQSINSVVLQHLLNLAINNKASFQANSIALSKVNELSNWLKKSNLKGINLMYNNGYVNIIDNFLKLPNQSKKELIPKIQDGAPIGSIGCDYGL
ncbi:MAG TPA: zinc-dependent metalloprotease, partial [Lutibacter sp.]|nr:zinc-dependent metalloprotease [Lutibacter sp.]